MSEKDRRLETPVPAGQVVRAEHVRAVRAGHGANCSSIGSVIDTLFVTALAGGAVFAAIAAAMSEESVRTVIVPPAGPRDAEPSPPVGEPESRRP
jgi:hypothetical protein